MDVARYLGIFVAECRDHLDRARDLGRGFEASGPEAIRELLRHAHSIKGTAASMGFLPMARLAHATEDLLDAVRRAALPAGPEERGLVLEAIDRLDAMLNAAERGEEMESCPSLERALRASIPGDGETASSIASPPREADGGSKPPRFRLQVRLRFARDPGAFTALRAAEVLGRLGRLGRLVATHPPAASLRLGRFDGVLSAEIETERTAEEVERALAPVTGLASLEVDAAACPAPPPHRAPPAAFVRVRADHLDALLEATIDLLLTQAGVVSTLAPRSEPGALRALRSCQSKLRALYGEIVEIRLVPFETVAARLVESVEDLASSLGKKVRFEILGRDVRLDRSLLDALVEPLLHVMRNSLDHGIESPRERKAAGKQPEGLLALELERRGEEIRISVRDDGRGLDPERLRQAAVRGGFLSAADAARLGSNEALELIVVPGLSTAPSPSQVSGRGVGMDVLRGALERLGGKLSVESEIGKGTTIGIRLPLAIAVVKTLLVRCRHRTLAIPISTVKRLGRLEEPPPSGNEGSPRIVCLADRLGLPAGDGASHEASLAVLCATSKGTVSLLVDEALGRHDALVKPLRSPLSLLPEYSGAALLDDGSVALVLDPSSL